MDKTIREIWNSMHVRWKLYAAGCTLITVTILAKFTLSDAAMVAGGFLIFGAFLVAVNDL